MNAKDGLRLDKQTPYSHLEETSKVDSLLCVYRISFQCFFLSILWCSYMQGRRVGSSLGVISMTGSQGAGFGVNFEARL